jgi:hypothetical protein
MKRFTADFASHFTLEEFVHYAEIGCIEGCEHMPLWILQSYRDEIRDIRERAHNWEERAGKHAKEQEETQQDLRQLQDTVAAMKKKLELAIEGIEVSVKNLTYIKQQFQFELL